MCAHAPPGPRAAVKEPYIKSPCPCGHASLELSLFCGPSKAGPAAVRLKGGKSICAHARPGAPGTYKCPAAACAPPCAARRIVAARPGCIDVRAHDACARVGRPQCRPVQPLLRLTRTVLCVTVARPRRWPASCLSRAAPAPSWSTMARAPSRCLPRAWPPSATWCAAAAAAAACGMGSSVGGLQCLGGRGAGPPARMPSGSEAWPTRLC